MKAAPAPLPLYERRPDGRLALVPTAERRARAEGRGTRLEISSEHGRRLVLLTPEEEAERAQKSEASEAARATLEAQGEARRQAAERARAKLAALGFDAAEIAALMDRS